MNDHNRKEKNPMSGSWHIFICIADLQFQMPTQILQNCLQKHLPYTRLQKSALILLGLSRPFHESEKVASSISMLSNRPKENIFDKQKSKNNPKQRVRPPKSSSLKKQLLQGFTLQHCCEVVCSPKISLWAVSCAHGEPGECYNFLKNLK